jgi:tetratricopeptide (TPR) repeat protein
MGYGKRLDALVRVGAPIEEIQNAGDAEIRTARESGTQAAYTFVEGLAGLYVELGILLDRVPAMIEESLAVFDEPEESDLVSGNPSRLGREMDMVSRHVGAVATLSECYEKEGDIEKARAALLPIPAYLETKSVPKDAGPPNMRRDAQGSLAVAHFTYWNRLATLDANQHKNEDALKDYREALARLGWSARGSARETAEVVERPGTI